MPENSISEPGEPHPHTEPTPPDDAAVREYVYGPASTTPGTVESTGAGYAPINAAVPSKNRGLGIAGLMIGLVGLLLASRLSSDIFAVFVSVMGLIFAAMSLRYSMPKGLPIAAVVVSLVALLLSSIIIVLSLMGITVRG